MHKELVRRVEETGLCDTKAPDGLSGLWLEEQEYERGNFLNAGGVAGRIKETYGTLFYDDINKEVTSEKKA
uniref:SFRICE_036907 n=1 Tax=Spodoptera frugiperda TaxID=7108 RepID=A0A2H1VJR4_SPOFR